MALYAIISGMFGALISLLSQSLGDPRFDICPEKYCMATKFAVIFGLKLLADIVWFKFQLKAMERLALDLVTAIIFFTNISTSVR